MCTLNFGHIELVKQFETGTRHIHTQDLVVHFEVLKKETKRSQTMHRTQNFGKRKLGGGSSSGGGGSNSNNPCDYFASPKNQRIRPCRDIVYTEDRVPVRKLYFCVSAADVSKTNYACSKSTAYCIIYQKTKKKS